MELNLISYQKIKNLAKLFKKFHYIKNKFDYLHLRFFHDLIVVLFAKLSCLAMRIQPELTRALEYP